MDWSQKCQDIGESVLRRQLCAIPTFYISTVRSRTPPTSAANFPLSPVGLPWLLSLRHVECRLALRPSSCAITARGEVSISPTGHGKAADKNAQHSTLDSPR